MTTVFVGRLPAPAGRQALAEAAHTTPDRVALHCVHQHNAPFIDRDGNALLRKAGADPLLCDDRFVDGLVSRSAEAVREAQHGNVAATQAAAPLEDGPEGRERQFAHFQSDAPACDNCGALTVRCGTCYRCFNCGNSMGCS